VLAREKIIANDLARFIHVKGTRLERTREVKDGEDSAI